MSSEKELLGNILGFADFRVSITVTYGRCHSSHGQRVNEWAWLCSNKTLYTKLAEAEIHLPISSLEEGCSKNL